MKIPGSVELGVQTLTGVNAQGPTNVANAEADVTRARNQVVSRMEKVAVDIYKRDASAERNSLYAEYRTREAHLRDTITRDPYEVMDDGTLRSRHGDIVSEYEAEEAKLRAEVFGKTTNDLAQQYLGGDLENAYADGSIAMQGTALDWANNNARVKNIQSANEALQSYDYDTYETIADEMVATAQINGPQYVDMLLNGEQHETYNTFRRSVLEGGMVSPKVTLERFKETYGMTNLPETKRHSLRKVVYDNISETFTAGLVDVVENGMPPNFGGAIAAYDPLYENNVGSDFGGVAAGEMFLRQLRMATPEELGLEDLDMQEQLYSDMEQTLNQYKLDALKDFDDMEMERACDAFTLEGSQPSSQSYNSKAADLGVHGKDPAAMNCAWGKRTQDHTPWSDEWIDGGFLFEARNFGHFSDAAQVEMNRWLINAENRPTEAGRTVGILMQAEGLKENIVDFLDPQSREIYEKIRKHMSGSAIDVENVDGMTDIITTITKQQGTIDPNLRAGRIAAFSAVSRDDYRTFADGMVADLAGSPATDWLGDFTITNDFLFDARAITEDLIPLYEDPNIAMKVGFQKTLQAYGVSSYNDEQGILQRNGWWGKDVSTTKNSPERVRDQKVQPKKVREAFNQDWDAMLDANELERNKYSISPMITDEATGETYWYVTDRETALPFLKDGMALKWDPNYDQTLYGRQEKFDNETAAKNQEFDLIADQIDEQQRLMTGPLLKDMPENTLQTIKNIVPFTESIINDVNFTFLAKPGAAPHTKMDHRLPDGRSWEEVEAEIALYELKRLQEQEERKDPRQFNTKRRRNSTSVRRYNKYRDQLKKDQGLD